MPNLSEMSIKQLCAFVSNHLQEDGIPVVLVGGACVTIYSNNKYQTTDLDFVERYDTRRKALRASLEKIGFTEKDRYFEHPDTVYFLEFPAGPISVGDEPIHDYAEIDTEFGKLVLLSATDSCKDRLAAFYHWRDEQSLSQAINIASDNGVDLENIREWSEAEGMLEKFARFNSELINRSPRDYGRHTGVVYTE